MYKIKWGPDKSYVKTCLTNDINFFLFLLQNSAWLEVVVSLIEMVDKQCESINSSSLGRIKI